MPFDNDLNRTSLVLTSPSPPGRFSRAPSAARAALALAALLVLALALAPRAGASVYWSNAVGPAFGLPGTTIGRATNEGIGVNQNFIGGASTPEAVAVDSAHVYWINDTDRHSIGRANLDGTGVNQRFITGVDAGSLAVDGAHIYWTDVVSGDRIGRAGLDGAGVERDFITGARIPSGVAVDRTHIYWTNADTETIGRANLDGTGADEGFIDLAVRRHPLGIAVDAAHLYWVDLTGTIGRANIDGTGVDPDFVPTGPFPSRVAVDATHIFWTNQFPSPDGLTGGTIGRANLDGTGVTETLIAGLADPSGVAADATTPAGTPSRVLIGDVRMAEGNAGQTAFRFTVSLDRAQPAPVTVAFATADGTASAPSDYAAGTGAVTFASGETAKTVTVQVKGDTSDEPDETFNVNLTNASGNATIGNGRAVGTIVNDDQPTGCAATNGSDVQISDFSTVESPISISGCTRNASATATVAVHIVHTYIGDLIVTLVAPDGSTHVLHNRTGFSTDDINQIYTVDLSSEPANGTWKLRVQDAAAGDVGRIDSWTIDLDGSTTAPPTPTPTPSPTPSPSPSPSRCTATNGSDVQISDLSTVESPISISGCVGNASATATVAVHIVHTFIGDLIVTLVAPDGSTHVLHDRTGSSTDDINQTYTVDLSSEPANGTWKLRVQDAAFGDVGRIDSWTISL